MGAAPTRNAGARERPSFDRRRSPLGYAELEEKFPNDEIGERR